MGVADCHRPQKTIGVVVVKTRLQSKSAKVSRCSRQTETEQKELIGSVVQKVKRKQSYALHLQQRRFFELVFNLTKSDPHRG